MVTTEVTGPLTIAWSGDPAHGCAAVGVCGVTGTLQMTFGAEEESASGGPFIMAEGDTSAVARVRTTAPNGSVTTCADLVPAALLFNTAPAGSPFHEGVNGPDAIHAFGAGRCAGPTFDDLAQLSLPARRDTRGDSLSGRISTIAGPFAVTAVSGVRVNIRPGTESGDARGGIDHAPAATAATAATPATAKSAAPRSALVEHAAVTYRITAVTGALTTQFAAAAPPACDPLGACGARGRVVQSLTTHGSVTFRGQRGVTRSVGRRRALADLREGTMTISDTFGALLVQGTVAETTTQTGGLRCHDTSSILLPLASAGRSSPGTDRVTLPGGEPFEPLLGDPFRTRCAGPAASDVLSPNSLTMAAATVRAGELGQRRLTITFRTRRTFRGSVFSGRRSGAVTLALTRERSQGGTRHEPASSARTVTG
ncbi:MAG TPA: hypothetical protein VMF14_20185 [Solirubrobacteraceae bacterium]|nr:hypothetical protein [Solirubrobacteraceae bacterium]